MTEIQRTVRETVAGDFRTAAVFQKYGLDFCCGGNIAIDEACRTAGHDPERVLGEIDAVERQPRDGTPDFGSWDVDFLADYIVANHHRYVRRVLPTIGHHSDKVARVHGERHPETVEIARLFASVADELESHMAKEEAIIFPYAHALATAARDSQPIQPPMFGTIRNPLNVMEIEHVSAGDALKSIRTLSSDFALPADACMTYQVLYLELQEFEADLHKHIHLENNILFPKLIALESQLLHGA